MGESESRDRRQPGNQSNGNQVPGVGDAKCVPFNQVAVDAIGLLFWFDGVPAAVRLLGEGVVVLLDLVLSDSSIPAHTASPMGMSFSSVLSIDGDVLTKTDSLPSCLSFSFFLTVVSCLDRAASSSHLISAPPLCCSCRPCCFSVYSLCGSHR